MKQLLLNTIFFSISFIISCSLTFTADVALAQKLYGLTERGGRDGKGAIIEYDASTKKLSNPVTKSFNNLIHGTNPTGELLKIDGKFYGVTQFGGVHNWGVIYSYDSLDNSYTKLYDFEETQGSPTSGLKLINNQLYGITNRRGAYDAGIIFSYTISDSSFSKLHDFDYANGAYPNRELTILNDVIYGITERGGTDDAGVIFSFNPSTGDYNKVHDFDRENGFIPSSNLAFMDNKLYGITEVGGANNNGVLFSYSPSNNLFTNLYDFKEEDDRPKGALIAHNGKLYVADFSGGSTYYGILSSFDTSTNIYDTLYEFKLEDGINPNSLIIVDGLLYGTTSSGGTYDYGVLFSYDPISKAYSKIQDFNKINGTYPKSLNVSDGKLFGIIGDDESNNEGLIFCYDPAKGFQTLLPNNLVTDGDNPRGNLLMYKNELYGMTRGGGIFGKGIIFSYNPLNRQYKKLYDFEGENGANPRGDLMVYKDKLYGMALSGGKDGYGVIFCFDPVNNSYEKIHDFDGINGKLPRGTLTELNGKLYGMTWERGQGSNYDGGVIFSLEPETQVFTKLHDFRGATGVFPLGDLTVKDGKLYGMTANGGNGAGVIFSYDPSKGSYTPLHFFDFDNGATPNGSLTLVRDKFYGMTENGGRYEGGVIFCFDPTSNTYTKLHEFQWIDSVNGKPKKEDGMFPRGSLTIKENILYGMTSTGGINNDGVVFEYDINANIFTKTADFNGINGARPYGSLTVFESSTEVVDSLLLVLENSTDSTLSLGWSHSSEIGINRSYEVFQLMGNDSLSLGTTIEANFVVENLMPCTDYSFLVSTQASFGNSIWSKILTVTTTDNSVPIAPVLDTLFAFEGFSMPIPVATDNCSGNIEGTTNDTIDFSIPGNYTITWEFIDEAGNTIEAKQIVIVKVNDRLSLNINLGANQTNMPLQIEIYEVGDSLELVREIATQENPLLIEGLIDNKYILKVIPNQEFAPELLPTYSGDVLLLANADSIYIDENTEYSITIKTLNQQEQKQGIIQGIVLNQNDNSGGRIAQDAEEATLLANIPVYAVSETNGDIKASAVSATDGSFRLDNLAVGIYSLQADYRGIPISLEDSKLEIQEDNFLLQVSVIIGNESIQTRIESVTGMSEELLDLGLALYPNPVGGEQITIKISEPIGNTQIRLFDTRGFEIKSLQLSKTYNQFNIDLKGISQGLYMLKLESARGTAVWKVVKK